MENVAGALDIVMEHVAGALDIVMENVAGAVDIVREHVTKNYEYFIYIRWFLDMNVKAYWCLLTRAVR